MTMLKILVAFSGGKDSQASLIWAVEKYGAKNIEAVFCDTGWEHELTYEHIKYVTDTLGVKLVTLKSKKYDGFLDMVIKKLRFPSSQARFCTEELKAKPMIDYILDECDCNVLVIQGIRTDESEARKNMQRQCTYFKYYFEPYQTNEMIVSKYSKMMALTVRQKSKLQKAKERLDKGFNDEKYSTYRKKAVKTFRSKYADDIIRPVIDKTGQEVMSMIIDAGQMVNPLYYQGAKRVGCYPCIMCSHGELNGMIKHHPKYVDRLIKTEQIAVASIERGATFFTPDFIPAYRHSKTDLKTGKSICTVPDVIRYIKDKNSNLNLWEEEEKSHDRRCMSYYAICE